MTEINPQTVFEFITLLGIMIGGYVKLMTKIKELDIRLNTVEKQDDKILTKLDNIVELVNDLKVEIQNKQDR